MNNPDPSHPVPPAITKLGYPWVKHSLFIVLAIGLGYVAASGIRYWRTPDQPVNQAILASIVANSNAANPHPPTIQPRLPVLAPSLNTAIIVGGSRMDEPEQLALPSGSVFALSLGANHSGSVDVYAINPKGRSTHLWSGHLQAEQELRTPQMRLQGASGVETIRIVFKADGAGDDNVPMVIKQLHILHV